jgi:hypothetical protein
MIDNIFIDLRTVSRSTITIFNWTNGLDSPPDPCPSIRSNASYSEDGKMWFQYYQARRIRLLTWAGTHSIYAGNAEIDEVVRKVEAGVEEPLGRQLFHEAWSQIGINPRSALVIGVAAAEVGLRGLIGTLVPAQKTKRPSVRKILRDFLPTLPVRARWSDGGPITPPPQLIRQIEKAIKYRNEVVHAGAPPPSPEELAKMLRAISDLLWICDVYLGERWAISHVSPETVKNWQVKGG